MIARGGIVSTIEMIERWRMKEKKREKETKVCFKSGCDREIFEREDGDREQSESH